MAAIHVLPPEVANKIAAGEVVERPSSVIRELLDNAIDAGASRIEVEVADGGLTSMRVTDNGCGMSLEDAKLCTLRHATSKIQSAEDLENIVTKGFRGEALASIAAVSKVRLITRRPEDSEATLVQISGGLTEETGPAAGPVGTTIDVSDLFFNTPARKKFLKRPTTEMGHICSTMTWLALAHEQIHFTLINNKRTAMELAGVADRAERIMSLYGRDIVNELLPLSLDTAALSISGFISKPSTTRNGSQHIFTFVNDRFIRNRTIQRALMDGYRNILPAKRYPIVFLYIELDPRSIDINVHPTKQEVKFAREDAVFSAVYGAIRQTWEQGAQVHAMHEPSERPEPVETSAGSAAPPEDSIKTAKEPATPKPTRASHIERQIPPATPRRDVVETTKRLIAPDRRAVSPPEDRGE
ncbi:MAG: DNA mismatch repair endonuclease MutL, partial [bacterium]